MSKYKNDPKYACTYMEIPQHDINKAERDFGLFGPTGSQTSPGENAGTKIIEFLKCHLLTNAFKLKTIHFSCFISILK